MPRYTEHEAREAIRAASNWSDALRRLGLCTGGGNLRVLQTHASRWEIATDHFDPGAGRRPAPREPVRLVDVLVEGSTYSRGHLKERLYAEGLKLRQCELCGQGEEWRGRRMSLILDHINGVRDDNRLENLRIVCPNCAATFDTHCGRKNRRPDRECERCGAPFRARRVEQRFCSRDCGHRGAPGERRAPRPGGQRVERPPYEDLVAEIAALGYSAVGRKYGVSDNAVRKWVLAYEAGRQ